MIDFIVTSTANLVRSIRDPEVRDFAAHLLGGAHAWRCGAFSTPEECTAVAMAYADRDAPTWAERRLGQPISVLNWMAPRPFLRFIDKLQVWEDDDPDERVAWVGPVDAAKILRGTLRHPLSLWGPMPNLFPILARITADQTWYSADTFIAEYVVEAARRLVADSHTIPSMFAVAIPEIGEEMAVACYKYSLEVLAQVAREASIDYLQLDTHVWMDALAEAISEGLLWD